MLFYSHFLDYRSSKMSWEVIDKFIQMAASVQEYPTDVERNYSQMNNCTVLSAHTILICVLCQRSGPGYLQRFPEPAERFSQY